MVTDKRESWNLAYYAQKKSRVLSFDSAVASIIAAAAAAATYAPSIAAVADPWSVKTNSTMQMPAERKMAKYQCMKPTVENILHAGKVEAQAAVLRAVTNYPSLAPARKLARINSSKDHGLQICLQAICLPDGAGLQSGEAAHKCQRPRSAMPPR
jgi:hypothetical protein